jgi:hypothetical protein
MVGARFVNCIGQRELNTSILILGGHFCLLPRCFACVFRSLFFRPMYHGFLISIVLSGFNSHCDMGDCHTTVIVPFFFVSVALKVLLSFLFWSSVFGL